MPLPSTGSISIGQIKTELGMASNAANVPFAGSSIPISSSIVGQGYRSGTLNRDAPHSMSEFRGYSSIVKSGLLMYCNFAVVDSYTGAGTLINDLSGNACNGVLYNGPIFSTSGGGSMIFDGTNDYAWFDGSIKGADTDSFTISCMMKVPAIDTAKGYIGIVRGWDLAGAYTEGWSLYVAIGGGAKPEVGIVTMNPSIVGYSIKGTTTLSSDTWYHITLVYTAGTNLSVYLNGVLENSVNRTNSLLRSSTYGFTLGAVGVSSFYNSVVGHALAYNRVLSASEILQNFNALKSRYGY